MIQIRNRLLYSFFLGLAERPERPESQKSQATEMTHKTKVDGPV
jgi:hypothetical protein